MPDLVSKVRLASGRTVAVHDLGDGVASGGPPIVLCHAAPGAGAFDPDPAETSKRGVALIAPDRPGYGGSEPVGSGEWASVDRAAEDIAEVLGERGIAKVGVAGWSAGGRVAMALAARHPDLVERVAVIATPAPHEEVPWIPPEQNAGLEALRGKPPEAVHGALGEMLSAMVPSDPRAPDAIDLIGGGTGDEAALARPGVRGRLADMLAAAFTQGANGIAADIAGYGLRPWGFSPADVRAKALLIYGDADPIAGSRHGSWWQRHLPDARLEVAPGAGHLVVVPLWQRVLSFLAPTR